MQRRIRFLVSASICSLLLAACNGSDNSTATAAGKTAIAGKKLRIGVSVPAADHGWTAAVIWWAKKAMAMYPDIDWTFSTAENPEKQIKDLETMMAKGEDAMVVLATESAAITPTAEAIHNRGILLVNVDRGFLKPVADVYLEGDNKALGRKSAEFIAKKLDGKGKIVIIEGIPCTVNTDRVQAAKDVFKQYPGIEILDDQTGMWNRQKALDVMQTFLLKHNHIDAVWTQDDDMSLGAEQAIKEAGRQKEMWIFGGGGMKEILQKMMAGDPMFPADTTYPASMAALAINDAVSILRDGKKDQVMKFMPRHMVIDVEMILPDTAKNFYVPDSVF